jgi:hypothetical protein
MLIAQDTEAEHAFDWELVARLRRERGEVLRHITGLLVSHVEPDDGTSDADIVFKTFIATDSHGLEARGLKLARGRLIGDADVRDKRPVCVLEAGAAQRAFDVDPIGRTIAWSGSETGELEVIGVTAPRATAGEALDEFGYHKEHPMRELLEYLKQTVGIFDDPDVAVLTADNSVMVPHTLTNAWPQFIELRADPRDVLRLRDELQQELSAAGYEPQIYVNAILPVLYGETIKTLLELNQSVFVLCIIVGTSVVCTIMVLSVVERQREIAIRRVEGARRWHIALQFVVETGTLCLVGAVAGVPLGIMIAMLRCALEPLGSVTWGFPPVEVSLLVAVVTAIGLVGGLLPAWRAMRVDPVEMLRYE